MKYQYSLSEFLADLMTVEDLKPGWSSDIPFNEHIAEYFLGVHGDNDYTEWRYWKFMAVNIYVSRNMAMFKVRDLAVVGEDKALVRGKLFGPVLEYAI